MINEKGKVWALACNSVIFTIEYLLDFTLLQSGRVTSAFQFPTNQILFNPQFVTDTTLTSVLLAHLFGYVPKGTIADFLKICSGTKTGRGKGTVILIYEQKQKTCLVCVFIIYF